MQSKIKWRKQGERKVLVISLDAKEEADADIVEVCTPTSTVIIKDRFNDRKVGG